MWAMQLCMVAQGYTAAGTHLRMAKSLLEPIEAHLRMVKSLLEPIGSAPEDGEHLFCACEHVADIHLRSRDQGRQASRGQGRQKRQAGGQGRAA